MTDLLSDVDAPSDAELISRVRGGDVAAYGELFSRHKDAANRLAKQLIRGPDADDLVSEAFAKVLTVIQGGGGPDVAFRAYLLTAVRRLHVDKIRAGQRLQTTDDLTPFDPGVPFKDTAVAGFESGAAAKAFASLPERWQLVLWHLEVEGQKPADIAPLLGMSANSVSALAYRAREGLRQAFLTMHLSDISDTDCRWVNEHLGAFVRKGLSKRDATKVQNHLDGCRRCTAMYLELADVNSNLAGIIAPLLLGAAAAGYLTSTGAGIGAGGVVSILSRSKDFVVANTGAVAAGAVATGVAAAAVATVLITQLGGGHTPDVVANPPASQSSALSSTPSTGPSASSQASTSTSPSAAAPTPTLSASTTPTASTSPSAGLNPALDLALLPSLLPSLLPTETPTELPTGVPTESPGGGSTDTPTPPPTSESPTPTPTETTPAPPPAPALTSVSVDGDIVGNDDPGHTGSVRVEVANVGPGDTVAVNMQSGQTTFVDPPGGCTNDDPRDVSCSPGGDGGAEAVAAVASTGDYTVTLPLDSPASMVEENVTITVSVNGTQLGKGDSSLFHPRRVWDFTLGGFSPGRHTLSGETDTYQVAGNVGGVEDGFRTVFFSLQGDGTDFFSQDQSDPRCALDATTVHGGQVSCTGLGDDGNVTLSIDSTKASPFAATVVAAPPAPFEDPDPADDNSDSTATVGGLLPGTNLTLANATDGPLRLDKDGAYHATLQLGGVRKGVPSVFLDLGPDATYADEPPGCTLVNENRLSCDDLTNGQITLAVKATDPDHPTALNVTANPGGDFEQVSNGNVADLALLGSHDFSIGELTRTAQSLTDNTDHYTLHTTIGAYPTNVGPLTYTISGAQFASTKSGCTYVDATRVTCADGPVDLAVESTSTNTHDVTVAVQTPQDYDDPAAGNDSSSITLQPGIDLKLADLDADNESPANDDRMHRVTSRLDGTRKGLDSVTYTLTGNATFVGASIDGCNASDKTLTCSAPSDGSVTFTVRADDVHVATDIRIAVSAPARFLELKDADNSDGVRLLPRPTYDFAMGALAVDAHTVTAGADHFTLGSTVGAVPNGVPDLTFAVSGGTFAADQDASCTRDDATHVTCTDLASARRIGFRVDSTSDAQHSIAISLVVPGSYDDTNAADDSASLSATPGIDLSMSALTPSAPTPTANGTYTVSSTLAGVRSGPVRFTVSGATVTGTSCSLTSGTLVTCNAPTNGQQVSFTLRPAKATAATPVTIHAQPADQFTELNPADNAASTILAPDVALTSVAVRSDSSDVAAVRAQITGVPSGTSVIRLQLSGSDAGTSPTQVHFTAGGAGADGQGPVDCYTSNANGQVAPNGVYATCTNVNLDADGSFFVDMELAHQHGRTSNVTVAVIPVGVDEGSHGGNDSRGLTLH